MTNTITGECMLLAWNESHSRGATITLLLSDPDELTPFKRLTVSKGKIAGQRLMYAFAEIGDDEQPVNAEKAAALVVMTGELTEEHESLKGGPLAKLAGILSRDPAFYVWLCKHLDSADPLLYPFLDDDDTSAEWIRRTCGVKSRRELDHDPAAARIFHEKIRLPYLASRESAA